MLAWFFFFRLTGCLVEFVLFQIQSMSVSNKKSESGGCVQWDILTSMRVLSHGLTVESLSKNSTGIHQRLIALCAHYPHYKEAWHPILNYSF
jgi:hypothetical protein